MRRIIFIISLILAIVYSNLQAQYFPVFSQYVSNGLILNPAYAGSREVLSLSLQYRDQWVEFDGSPKYETFSAHAPLKNNNIGVGVLVLNENSGPLQNTHAYLNYAYRIRINKGRLALGLKAGLNYLGSNYKNIKTNVPDPAFTEAKSYYILPNFGAGVYYYTKHFFAGLSIPYFLSYASNSSYGYSIEHDVSKYSYLLSTGFLIDINRNFKIKPTTLIKYSKSYEKQVDFNLNFITLNDKIWIGGSYRLNEAYAAILELQINPQLRFGYSYDYSMNTFSSSRFSSHEISLRYEFTYKIKAASPRYF